MTSIKDLENRVKNAEVVLKWLKDDLTELKEQEKDKQPEPESLFGRWAEHPYHGRGVIISNALTEDRRVLFAHKIKAPGDNIGVSYVDYVDYENLKTDPATLTTAQEFENAPEGTIVETGDMRICHKVEKNAWLRNGSETAYTHLGMTSLAEGTPSRVIRWGEGK